MRELVDLVAILLRDPSSWLHAAVAEWDHPVSWEWIAAVDLYDLQHASKSKRKTKPYPRPWPEKKTKIGGKRTVRRSAPEVLAILRPQQ